MRNEYSLGKRLLALFLSAVLVFGMVPANQVFAVGTTEQTGFGFETPQPEALTYQENLTYTNIASGGEGTGTVTYRVTAGDDVATVDGTTGELTIIKAGSVTVTATKASDDTYAEATASYTLVINEAIPEFAFEDKTPDAIAYAENLTYKNIAVGGAGIGAVTYEITEGADIATIDRDSGELTINKAGTVTVKATKSGESEQTATYTLQINLGQQSGFAFETAEPEAITYAADLTFTNVAVGGQSSGIVSYEVTTGTDVATIDAATGKLTILKSGTVTVKAIKTADEKYAEATATYTLVVKGMSQTGFAFETETPESLTISDGLTYTNTASGGQSNGVVTYEITQGTDIATIDAATGELTITKHGTIVVKATLAGNDQYADATAAYTLVVNGIAQTGFAFETAMPEAVTYNDNGNEYSNVAVGGESTGAVSYEVISGSDVATVDAATGKLTILKSGTVTVKATKAGDNYYTAAEATYTLTINKDDQGVLAFATETPDALTYSDGLTFSNVASGGVGSGAITYEIVNGTDVATINGTTGELTILKAGTVTVKATKAADDYYDAISATYSLIINMADQSGFAFETADPDDVVFAEGLTFSNTANGGIGSGTITYEVVSGLTVATVNSGTGVLTIHSAGTVTVKATKAADDKYSAISATYTITITKADQTGMGFADSAPVVTYGDNNNEYSNALTGAMGTGDATYEITDGIDVATINTSTGTLTILKSGTVTVKVTKAGDNSYNGATASYTLTVNKADQSGFAFETAVPSAITYNDNNNSFTNVVINGKGEGAISYEITAGSDIASIDVATGELTILKAGSVTVKATKAGDDCFNEATASYSLTINKDDQDGFGFATAEPTDLTYTDNLTFTNAVINAKGTGALVYEIIEGRNVARIDATTGELSISRAGTITVKATKAGDDCYNEATATYTLTINRANQTGFSFATPNPEKMTYAEGLTFTNVASGGWGEGDVTYEVISGEDVATVDENGVLTILKAGEVTVEATRSSGDRFNSTSVKYSLTIEKADQTGFAFETATPNAVTFNDNNNKFVNNAINAKGEGKLTYEVIAGVDVATINASTGELTILKSGTVTVRVTKDGDDCYNAAEATYTLTVNKDDQDGFGFATAEPDDIAYNDNGNKYTNAVINAKGNGELVYEITAGNDVATINATTGELTILKSGVVTVKATKKTDDCYNEATATYTLTVNKDDQDGFGFTTANPAAITYNDNGNKYTNAVLNAKGDGKLTYEIIAGSDVATINAATGELTILKSGTVTVKVTKETDDRYLLADATYTLTINKAGQTISFVNNPVNEIYGIKTYTNSVVNSELHGIGELTYEIVGENKIGASIDAATGKLTFGDSTAKIGTITVKVTRAADDCYNACSGEFTFTLNYEQTPDTAYSLSGKTENTSGWYTGDVTITAPDGYLISYHNLLTTADWAESVVYSTEGTNTFVVYLKNIQTGSISDAISVNSLKIDKTDAIDLTIEYKDLVWETILEDLFGFAKQSIVVNFSAEDEISGVALIEYSLDGGENYTELKAEAGVYSITINPQYRDELVLRVTDVAGNVITSKEDPSADNDPHTVVVDSIPPVIAAVQNGEYYFSEQTQIYYTKDNAFSVTFTVTDANYDLRAANPVVKVNGEVQNLNWTSDSTSGVAVLELPDEGHFDITVDFEDRSGNSADQYKATVYVDKTAPKVNVSYSDANLKDAVVNDPATISAEAISRQTTDPATADSRFVYNGTVVATVSIEEVNFYSEDVVILLDGAVVAPDNGWTEVADNKWEATVTVSAEGDHVLVVGEYADRSGNAMNWSSSEYAGKAGTALYTSNNLTIDKTAPTIKVSYNNETVVNEKYYDANRTATVLITDRNFRPNEVELVIVDVDAANKDTSYTAPNLKVWSAWTYVGDNTWEATIPFDVDANYTVTVNYKDIAENVAEAYNAEFTVDKVNPQDLSIAYSDGYANAFEEIIDTLTFGVFYYGSATEVKLTVTDLTSGLNYIKLNAKQNGSDGATTIALPVDLVIDSDGKVISGVQGDVSNIKVTNVDGVMTVTFTVPEEFRGEFMFEAVDMANRSTDEDDNSVVVVDAIAPTRTVTYEPTKIVSLADMKDVDAIAEGDSVVMYYNTDAVATIRIEEANFYASDIVIKVNGETVAPDNGWVNLKGENDETTDIWEATVTLADEGDYVITMTYTDRSKNEMVKYESQRIVIDKTAPIINVSYGNNDVKNTVDNRSYYNTTQTATVTIKEHNFRADEVIVKVSAQNVVGTEILKLNADGTVEAYANQGADRASWSAYKEGSWRRDDDTYVLTLTFDADANYTFDVEYQDMATNKAADYTPDYFTVDKTAPTNLEVSYSAHVFEEILESITFGYYNAQMTVTITAVDDTSGIYHFAYSYINSEGVSGVNAELLDQAIQYADISHDGSKATATFTIPKMVLGNDNQFNGTVKFTAYDRSENNTDKADNKRIVVDNISPTATVTYNAAVQEANGISYHDGNITATININEANFDSGDVNVTVTKDGANYPVNVAWVNNSVDSHTGTFTLTEDGDYIVTVTYRDKSGNQMNTYTSNQLTLDTTLPVIEVSNIKMNSANKNEVYGFTITVNDTNLDVSSLVPKLTAVVKGDDGKYSTKEIDLGEAQVVVAGQTYTFTVEDLPEDALYSLTCSVKDMAGNAIDEVVLEDEQAYGLVQFSINRLGSTFGFGDDFTEELVGQYYVYSVDNDVVIVEVNVDPIENYVVKLNGTELVEGVDFTTEQTSKNGEWSKRTYVINKELFAEEGEYSIIVSSTDKAESTAYSDVKNLTVAFVVDQTAPVITISGLANEGRYQTDEQTVSLIPSDEGGRLNSLKVVVMDADGNPLINEETGENISLRFEMNGEELLAYLDENGGKITFTVPSGYNLQVQVICNDCAINANGETNEYNEIFTKVTVSQSQLVIFYANKPAFYGTIAGSVALLAVIILLLKRKKNKKKANSLT